MQNAQVSSSLNLKDLKYDTSAEILKNIDLIHSLLLKAGIPTQASTPKAVRILYSLDQTKKDGILQNLKNWHAILGSVEFNFDTINERQLASRALHYFKFHLKNHDWLETSVDEIIEIYNPQGIQLYRSLNFFKTCGYSLLDLCVNEWYILWERPKSVLDRMHSVVADVLNGVKTDTAMGVGPHLIRETYDDGTTQPFQPRAAVVEFKNIYPAYGPGSNEIIGFVVTSCGKLISEGDDALKLDFI